ncbi:MAG: hypothetical protein WCQ80_04060 [Bacilli bacterium]
MRKYLIGLLIIIGLFLSTTVFFVTSFLTDIDIYSESVEIGDVRVIGLAYYENEDILTLADQISLGNSQYKQGVYFVNISDNQSSKYIENLRIHIQDYSNVETYFRVKIIEQKTIKYTREIETENGVFTVVTEVSKLMEEPTDLNFETSNWYDNRAVDGYFYYTQKSIRSSASEPMEHELISSYFSEQFYSAEPANYSLQIGIIVEAVQAGEYVEENWGMETPPWGGNW